MATIAVCTATFYPNPADVRAKLALEFARALQKLVESGVPLKFYVVDGSPSAEFYRKLEALGATVFRAFSGKMGPDRRQVLRLALEQNAEDKDLAVIFAEPEKRGLATRPFGTNCIELMAEPILAGTADIVVPERQPELFRASYPDFQYFTEQAARAFMRCGLGIDWDEFFGPFAANRKALQYLLDYPGNLPNDMSAVPDTWDATHLWKLLALKGGMRVATVAVPYIHPAEQTKQEQGNLSFDLKRIDQLRELLGKMMELWQLL